ncbi:MBL fold metallo-hydrolase [Saccharopolyspora phatthalungensis]|uniref:Glyoxylase-like metal-dependent hydrolase (Beta-lactamase superfamily II) n=1 Tax=Saccharopolyspora phatthalungensis TaxID=664693 RepID=A0A840QB74_9PSEU|nr:MBL fold metallo-hydrolase [Saccharopolyspora phatthalungensis]MBB5157197.1 glyoxylase-like metal-dependent hydrolase (beta-lactamase superfamily II) [Saccharopolyspora phatthalungensis]
MSDNIGIWCQEGWTRFQHGGFECTVVSDGLLEMGPARENFPNADPDEVDALLEAHYLSPERVLLNQNLLIVDTPSGRVLFDTGVGTVPELGVRTFGPQTGKAVPNMKSAGISPEDIDIVAITHAHPDHCWGLVDAQGKALYPNARVIVSEADYRHWTDLSQVDAAPNQHMKDHYIGADLNLNAYNGRLQLIGDGEEVVPGITAIATPGHSPGHIVYKIASGNKTMICWGDLCHHYVLLLQRPDWGFQFDYDKPAATTQRRRIYDLVDTQRYSVFAYHFPFPGLGHLRRIGEGYTWLPNQPGQD